MSKKFNLNCAQNKRLRRRPLNPKTDCFYEEELYVKGCTAVWSKGTCFFYYFFQISTIIRYKFKLLFEVLVLVYVK